MSDRAVTFANTERIEHKAFDLDRSELIAKIFLPYDEAKATGIEVVPMPNDLVLRESKEDGNTSDGKKGKPEVNCLHMLGPLPIAVLGTEGEILNQLVGGNFRGLVPVGMATPESLAQAFTNCSGSKVIA